MIWISQPPILLVWVGSSAHGQRLRDCPTGWGRTGHLHRGMCSRCLRLQGHKEHPSQSNYIVSFNILQRNGFPVLRYADTRDGWCCSCVCVLSSDPCRHIQLEGCTCREGESGTVKIIACEDQFLIWKRSDDLQVQSAKAALSETDELLSASELAWIRLDAAREKFEGQQTARLLAS